MQDLKRLQDKVFNANQSNSFELTLEVYQYQSKNNPVFRQFLELTGKLNQTINKFEDLCFLPVELFKSNVIKSGSWKEAAIFRSSGTSSEHRSCHYLENLSFYNRVSQICFEYHFGPLKNYEFLALLPNYLERQDSSLVAMVSYFVNSANKYGKDVFFINDFEKLYVALNEFLRLDKPVMLFGVSFALLDFANQFKIEFPNLTIIETGGMKGRHREIAKSSLLSQLQTAFPKAKIGSEYGMTELLWQAYAVDGVHYRSHPIIKFLISDPADPFSFLPNSKRGIINVIDLANVHSCSFIQTGDLGEFNDNNELQVLGRFDFEELRGCSQLYEE